MRLLIGAQMVFWVGYLLTIVVLLIAAARQGGFTFYPFAGGSGLDGSPVLVVDPKDVLDLGTVGYILHGVIAIVALFGLPPAVLLAGIGWFATLTWRLGRSSRWLLGASTVLTTVAVAVQLTPWGGLIRTWMLD